MVDLTKKYLFRMTHIENIPHVLKYGITHNKSVDSNPAFVPIGDGSLIETRNKFQLVNGKQLGDYIPFYFAFRTPMLYVIQHGFNMVSPTDAEKIIYCVSSVQRILDLNLDFVFTDGHAVDFFSTLYYPKDVRVIDAVLDLDALKAKYWKDENDLDRKRRKEAEFLVINDIKVSGILGYVVYNENAKKQLLALGVIAEKIKIDSNYYF
jgi:hypothetical protein